MSYSRTWNFLKAQIPELGALEAQRLTQRAWEKIRDSRDNWSFLVRKTHLEIYDAISAGSVTVTQGAATVTADAAAATALDAQHAITANFPGWTFRLGIGGGPVYRVASYSSPTITLERNYFETSGSAQTYALRQAYVQAPSSFKRWISVIDTYEDFGLNIDTTKAELDEIDPQRAAVDTPWALAAYAFEQNASPGYTGPLYELYPHPASRRLYPALYALKDYDWVGGATLPVSIPETMIEDMAMIEAYEWAEANRERHKGLMGADWRFLIQSKAKAVAEAKKDARNNDANLLLQAFGRNYLHPKVRASGAHYLQAHAPYHPR